MHPVQLTSYTQPTLVEPGNKAVDDPFSKGIEEPVQPVSGALGHRGDSALRQRGAEQLGQRSERRVSSTGTGPHTDSTIAVIRGPYGTGALTPCGAVPQVVSPQRAAARDELMLCHLHLSSATITVID